MTSSISSRITRASWALARTPTFRPTLRRQQATAVQSSTHSTLRRKSTITKFLAPLLERVSHYRNTGSGRPCDCPKCLRAEWRPYCGLCREKPTAHQELTRIRDGIGASEYVFTNWCENCWEARLKRRTEEEKEHYWEQEEQNNEQEMLEAKRAKQWKQERALQIRQAEVNNMLEQIMRLPPGERVPLSYAVQRYIDAVRSVDESIYISPKIAKSCSSRNMQSRLSKELRITKVGRWYFCDKRRADSMDFKLWHFRKDLGFILSQSPKGDLEKSPEGSYLWDWVRSIWSGKKM